MPDMSQLLDFNTSAIQEFSVNLIGVILLLIAGYIVARILRSLSFKALTKGKLDQTLALFVSKSIFWLIFLFILLACLSIFGIQTTSVAAVIGAGGLAIGLAFQGTLSNFAAGVMLAIFHPFKVNNFITVDGKTGTVNIIDLFTTTLTTPDNRVIIIPNSKIFGATIEIVDANPTRRIAVAVETSYDDDLEATREALEKATKVEGSLEEPAAAVVLSELGESGIEWSVRTWSNTKDFWTVRGRLVANIKKELDNAKIEIPFRQIVVTTKK